MTLIPQPILPAIVDSTQLNCFSSCPQKFYNEYVLGLRPPDLSINLHAGAVFSATLESFYREVYTNGLETPQALARAYATFTHQWGDFIIRKDRCSKTPENMWAAVEDYVNTYPPRSDSVQPCYTSSDEPFEYSFAIPLDLPGFPRHPVSGDPFIYAGRFDMLGRKNGRPVIRDEKTADRLESNWSEKWDLRSQFLGYCWALQHVGIPCNTVIVRGVIVTLTSIRQVEAEKLYSNHLIGKWFEQLKRNMNRLVACWNDGYFDYNLGDVCTQYSHCQFIPLCSSPEPANWYSSYEVRRWNPLNRNPTTAPTAPSGNGTGEATSPSSPAATTTSGDVTKIPATVATIT